MFLTKKVIQVASSSETSFKHASFLIDKKGNRFFLSCNDFAFHSEINTLNKLRKYMESRGYSQRKMKRKIKTLVMVNVRILRQGKLVANSKPCKHCLDELKRVGLKKVIYTECNKYEVEKVRDMENEHITMFRRSYDW